MTEFKTTKRFILPALLALGIIGAPFGYQYFKLKNERSTLADRRSELEMNVSELEAKGVSQESELNKRAQIISEKEARLSFLEDQLKMAQALLDQREQEYQAALAKLQREQTLARQKVKVRPPFISAPAAKVGPSLMATPPAVKPEEILHQARALGPCAFSDGGTVATRELTRLKRKISATSFKINYRPVDLIPNIRTGFPEELLQRLEESDDFLPRNVSIGIGYPPFQAQPDSLSSADIAREVAITTGSQFVLSGVIDAGIGRTDYGRWIEVEVDAYDGLSGVLVAKSRQGMEIADGNEVETGSLFGSAQYFNTPFGKRFDALMKSLAKGIEADLACIPFTAKITDIDRENNKIYIDSGAVSRLVPGDKFVAYHLAKRIQSESVSNELLGVQTIPVASLTIRLVFPLFSIGELSTDPKKTELQAGDFVSAQQVHVEKRK